MKFVSSQQPLDTITTRNDHIKDAVVAISLRLWLIPTYLPAQHFQKWLILIGGSMPLTEDGIPDWSKRADVSVSIAFLITSKLIWRGIRSCSTSTLLDAVLMSFEA